MTTITILFICADSLDNTHSFSSVYMFGHDDDDDADDDDGDDTDAVHSLCKM